MDLPHPASVKRRATYRRRRVIWVGALTAILLLVFFAPISFWDSSPEWHDQGYPVHIPGDNNFVNDDASTSMKDAGATFKNHDLVKEIELKNLLHMVVSSERTIPADADTDSPLNLTFYGGEVDTAAWLADMRTDPPLVVFSKTYCPYSKKAKALLETIDISPLPKIIEVDLRADSDKIKALLTRLTNHATFPNVILSAKSLGGYDSLETIHNEGRLVPMLEDNGLMVGIM